MKLLSNYNTSLLKSIGVQKITPCDNWRLATYTYMVNIDDNTFLYNNISKRLYLLDNGEATLLTNLNNSNINLFHALIEDWTLVKSDFNDKVFIDQVRWLYENINRTYEKTNYVIFTTTKCNARCYYCFEHGQRRIDMSEKTAEDVAQYIIENSPKKEVYIKWFGGEPLYNQKAMDIICDRLRDAGVKYNTKATTNGYLFDDETIKKAKEKWHLNSTVITLDGTEEIYNKTKNYIYKEGNPFKIVLKNIEKLLNNSIRVSIRLNIGVENFENIKELIIYLQEVFPSNNLLNFVPIALYDLEGIRSNDENVLLNDMVSQIQNLIIVKKYKKNTLRVLSDMGTRCMAESDNCKVITPVGGLGTCEHFSEGEMIYGSIYSKKEKVDIKNYFKQRDVLDDCKTCVFYPNCGGVGRCPTQTRCCADFERESKFRNLNSYIQATYEAFLENGCITLT